MMLYNEMSFNSDDFTDNAVLKQSKVYNNPFDPKVPNFINA